MNEITNLPEFINQLGKNFKEWRKFHYHDQEKLAHKLSRLDPIFSDTLLSRFESGILGDFIQAAADALCVSPESFLNPPEDLEDDNESQDEAESWSKWDRNTPEEKKRAFKLTTRYGNEHNWSEAEQDYVARMLLAPPHLHQRKYKRKAPPKKCCEAQQVEVIDKYTINSYDPQNNTVTNVVMYCTNCRTEWMEGLTNGTTQLPAATA